MGKTTEEEAFEAYLDEREVEQSDPTFALNLEHRMNTELGETHTDFEDVLNMNTSERAEYFKEMDAFDKVLAERELEITDGSLQNEKANPHQHSMRIIPVEAVDGAVDIDLLATIEFTNGVNGKTHELAVWASDGGSREFEPHYVYMNSPRDLDFERSDTYKDALSDNLIDSQLFYLIEPDEEIESVISDHHDGVCTDFEFKIPTENQRMDLHEIIVDEELADILIKSESNLLEKSDLVDFGKLVGNDLKDLDFSFDEDLKKSFDNALSNSVVAKDEIPHLKASYQSLNIKEPDSFSNNKKPLKQEMEQGLER